VGETRAVQPAKDGGEVIKENALEVNVFLVRAYYVWRSRERVGVACCVGWGGFMDVTDDVIRIV
jgi:hypothetical protein